MFSFVPVASADVDVPGAPVVDRRPLCSSYPDPAVPAAGERELVPGGGLLGGGQQAGGVGVQSVGGVGQQRQVREPFLDLLVHAGAGRTANMQLDDPIYCSHETRTRNRLIDRPLPSSPAILAEPDRLATS
jgi:hypothetical protein